MMKEHFAVVVVDSVDAEVAEVDEVAGVVCLLGELRFWLVMQLWVKGDDWRNWHYLIETMVEKW